MEAPPTSALVVAEAKVLLQILPGALDARALVGNADEFVDGDVLGYGVERKYLLGSAS
ncbi:MAG: hypothetical protein JWQ03_2666 [Variovorax sp.]|nr:hypothetical protein [Variovorax sp.]